MNRINWTALRLAPAAIVVGFIMLVVSCGTGPATTTAAAPVDSGNASDTGGSDSGAAPATVETQATESAAEPTAEPAPTATTEPPAKEPDPAFALADEPVVFNDDFGQSIQPIFMDRCASCHAAGGPGSPHWSLETAQDAVDNHQLISDVVSTRYMPPWPASDLSVDFRENRSLGPDQLQALLDWAAAGASLDVAADTPLPPTYGVVGLDDPDLIVAAANPYGGDPNTIDDYRCQIYDPQLVEDGWITAYEFQPDQLAVVHHAIGYLVGPAQMDRAKALDGADGRPGWECYGSSGLGNDDIFLGWAPGQDASSFPEGSGLPVPAGGFIVLQIHYHYEGDAPADASTLAVTFADDEVLAAAGGSLDEIVISETVAPVEIPCASWETGPLCDRAAALADAQARFGPGGVRDYFTDMCGYTVADFVRFTDGVASSSCEIPAVVIGATGELVAVLGHMHEIGSWFRMTLNPGTADELVLLDIPKWDFDWQYNYEPVDEIIIGPSDSIMIECGWDRSLRRSDLPPAYILWADGTNDEMCFATLTMRQAKS